MVHMTVPTCFTSNNSVHSSLFQANFKEKSSMTFLFSRICVCLHVNRICSYIFTLRSQWRLYDSGPSRCRDAHYDVEPLWRGWCWYSSTLIGHPAAAVQSLRRSERRSLPVVRRYLCACRREAQLLDTPSTVSSLPSKDPLLRADKRLLRCGSSL